jgi:elongation factor Ts
MHVRRASHVVARPLNCGVMRHRPTVRFIDTYVHDSKIGVLIELETGDDFTTRTDDFRKLARDLAMQVAANDPQRVDNESVANVVSMVDRIRLSEKTENALLTQQFIKDSSMTVSDRIRDVEVRLKATIRVIRFVRFAVDDA